MASPHTWEIYTSDDPLIDETEYPRYTRAFGAKRALAKALHCCMGDIEFVREEENTVPPDENGCGGLEVYSVLVRGVNRVTVWLEHDITRAIA